VKAYVSTTGALFGLLVVAHALRVLDEGMELASDPWFLLTTLAAAALAVWAWGLLRSSRPGSGGGRSPTQPQR
jgi:hypothetical protein